MSEKIAKNFITGVQQFDNAAVPKIPKEPSDQAYVKLNIEAGIADGDIPPNSPAAEIAGLIPSLEALGVKACDSEVAAGLTLSAKLKNGCSLDK